MDNELLLFDRIEAIKTTINQYGAENFYLSFSGGKDSTVLHHLVDMALPENTIPRVYCNTGIEYNAIAEFVNELKKTDNRIQIIRPEKNIKKTLEEKGYPFKSKMYSQYLATYQRNADLNDKYFEKIKNNPELLNDYQFIHGLPDGVKFIVKQYYGVRERERERDTYRYERQRCP